jgi:predicted DNA-binding transcriptional regulator AlpA
LQLFASLDQKDRFMSGPNAITVLLFIGEVSKITRLSRRTIQKYVDTGQFPPPFKIGNRNAWLESTVLDWVTAQSKKQRVPVLTPGLAPILKDGDSYEP